MRRLKKAVHSTDTDVLLLMRAQHRLLRDSIQVLTSHTADEAKKQRHLRKFIGTLKMHSEAEEHTIYDVMRGITSEEQLVLEAEEEHSLAKQLVSDLETMDFQYYWNPEIAAKAKVLAELVDHHAREEEKEFFREARRNLTKFELQAIGHEFLKKCAEFRHREAPFHGIKRIRQMFERELSLN